MAEHPERIKTVEELPSDFTAEQRVGAKRVFALRERDLQTIESTSLVPQADFQITDAPLATEAVGFQGALETQATQQVDTFKTADELTLQKAGEGLAGAGRSLEQILAGLVGQEELAFRAEQEAGVPERGEELRDINQQILQEQVSLQRQIEALEKNPEGKFFTQLQDDINDARTASLRRQADLSIIQLAAQGKFDSAKAIADRAVSIQFERQKIELEFRLFTYEENKELFDKFEQRAFEKQHAADKRETDREEAAEQLLQDTKLESLRNAQINNAPMSVLRAIQICDTAECVLEVGGAFGAGVIKTPRGEVPDGEPLSLLNIGRFKDLYGWTPPIGFSQAELVQYMNDNPDATPAELEAGARSVSGEVGTVETSETVTTFIMENMTDAQQKILFKKAQDADISRFFRGKTKDVEAYLESIKDKIQTAIDSGFSSQEILDFLTQ